MVEPPVFPDAVARVAIALHGVVPPPGAARRHFQHQVRWLAYFVYDIAVAGNDAGRVDTKGHYAVGHEPLGFVTGPLPQVAPAGNQHVVPVGEVQVQDAAEIVYPWVLLHINFLRRVGKRLQVTVVGYLRA